MIDYQVIIKVALAKAEADKKYIKYSFPVI
jgi:hypothetical protein